MARLLLSVAAAAAEESHFACLFNCTGSSVCWYDVCIPSPTPLVTPPADDHSVSIGISHKRRLIQSILIAAASFLAFSFLLLLLFYFLRRRRRQLASLHHQHPLHPNAAADLPDDDDDGGPHHVWYIRTVGLDDSVIRSIAATIYKAGDGLIDGGDCPVCLGEFMEGETIKLLPKCTHAFHLSCIDTWLRSHVNCPLCRAPVVAPPPAAASPAEADGSVPSPENAQIELSQRESQEECVIAIDSAAAAAAASSSSGQLDGDEDGEVQPIRRSVSMDSSSLGMLLLRVESGSEAEEKLGEEKREIDVGAHKNKGKMVVECLGKQQQQQGVEMKRSLSSRSERLFLSIYGRGRGRGRGRTASFLPL